MESEKINEIYQITMSGLRAGDPVDKYEKMILEYVKTERFEYCAGIRRAIDAWKKKKS